MSWEIEVTCAAMRDAGTTLRFQLWIHLPSLSGNAIQGGPALNSLVP